MSPTIDKLSTLLGRMGRVPPILNLVVISLSLVVLSSSQPPLWAGGLLTFFYGMLVYAACFSEGRRTNK